MSFVKLDRQNFELMTLLLKPSTHFVSSSIGGPSEGSSFVSPFRSKCLKKVETKPVESSSTGTARYKFSLTELEGDPIVLERHNREYDDQGNSVRTGNFLGFTFNVVQLEEMRNRFRKSENSLLWGKDLENEKLGPCDLSNPPIVSITTS